MSLILVIEDDRTQRFAAVQALKKAGHQVIEAVDGIQGLEQSRTFKPDLVVCDVMMPGMNGYQLVTALRADREISDIPIIMLTAMTERAHMRIAMTSGADDYLSKPFSARELNEAAAALIARRQSQRDGIVNAIQSELIAAFDEQRQELAAQYERRFLQELNSRWERGGDANAQLPYEKATVLVTNLFKPVLDHMPRGMQHADAVRRAYQTASDSLYLFGARHLLTHGDELVAIFLDQPESIGVAAELRAVRAAFTLARGVATMYGQPGSSQAPGNPDAATDITIAVHHGPVTLIRVSDPLHGGPDATLATGATLGAAKSLSDFARQSGWTVVTSATVADGMADQIRTGHRGTVAGGDPRGQLHAVELLGVG